jgi:hypothetical protein
VAIINPVEIMANTKTCPECSKSVKSSEDICPCGYDFRAEECPGCDKRVLTTLAKCPHCGYNFLGDEKPKKEPKPPKPPKEKKPKAKEEEDKPRAAMPSGYRAVIWVPALGRPGGQPPLEFPELHWKGDAEPTDEEFLAWVEDLRYAYAAHDGGGYLSNHAVSYLVSHEKTLNKYKGISKRVITLLGGDDWK